MKFFVVALLGKAAGVLLEGLLQAEDTLNFLTCDGRRCSFTSDQGNALTFKRESGDDGQYKFVVQDEGTNKGKCLDRQHCHKGHSNARLSDCNHCGSYHWQLSEHTGMLAEDHNKNCIQDDGSVRHCHTFQPVRFFQPLKPFNPPKGGWKLAGSTVSSDLKISIEWGTESSDSQARTKTWAASLEASFAEGLIFEKTSIKASVSQSIATTMSNTFTRSVHTGCDVNCAYQEEKPFTFVYQWFTESTHQGASGGDVTRATSCSYMCIRSAHGEPIKPKCAFQCCYDVDCQICNDNCNEGTSDVVV